MAHKGFLPVPEPVMESVPLAIGKIFAIPAFTTPGPAPVPEWLEPGFPHLIQVILVNVSLGKGAVDVRAGRDGSVNQYGPDIDPCPAEEGSIPHF